MNNLIPGFKIEDLMDDVLNRSLSDIIGTDFSHTQASLNVIDTDENLKVELAAPGLKKADFEVKIDKGILSIAVDQKTEADEASPNYKRREYNYTSFKRSITLPETVDALKVEAQYKNGLLIIEIAKKDPEVLNLNKQIKIK